MSTTQESKKVCKTQNRQILRTCSEINKGRKYGRCLICSDRLRSIDEYVTTQQGYCCQNCLEKLAEE